MLRVSLYVTIFLRDTSYPKHHVGNNSRNLCETLRYNQKIILKLCSFDMF